MRTVCRTQSGTSARGISATGRPDLSTTSGTNRSRSGSTSRSAWYPGATAPRCDSPCHDAALSVAQTSASSGGIPAATASRTIELMCPSSAMCSGSRSSVQNAILLGPYSASSGSSACRFRAAEASRISSHIPRCSRSRPSSAVYASWSERMPAAM